ncbi:flavodoxin family protein [Leucobacter sp. UCMA 4100]|uniref:flavodoxin family protein n=1 Tax=Leucobacter sp. UCMA 4100 TaxID=2810534 RepID=UPI0022EA6FEF|nr:NAD(P)H-dependent oxidoreductase [Leucobacter sp. UCMA 4100]MDA3146633.1 flavodoxin family protein [Leucobacter sp. UCMA 4100]
MATLLVVHHSPTPRTLEIAQAVLEGTRLEGLEDVTVVERNALEATVDDVLAADGYLLGSSVHFGYLSGALKHFFDTTFNATHEATKGRPFSYWLHGSYDSTGAEIAMQQITTGYGWKLCTDPLVFLGEFTAEMRNAATELGATVAASC